MKWHVSTSKTASLSAAAGLIMLLLITSAASVGAQSATSPYRVVGYYAGYGIYEDYTVTDIPARMLTHLNYGFIGISELGQCQSEDLWTDTQYPYPLDAANLSLKGNIRQLQLLRGNYPNLKILMTVGGWDYSGEFSTVAATPASRQRFAASCVAFMRQYLFDGIDIDWRYPVSGGPTSGSAEDRENFTLLMAELRTQLDAASTADKRPYLLTMLSPAIEPLYKNIEIDQIHRYVDWINLMSFGFHGSWSEIASHHAPLFANTQDPRGANIQEDYNVDGAVRAYIDAGVPANKIVVGVPFYGQTWRVVNDNDYFGIYQQAQGVPAGTRPGGVLYYRDLVKLLNNQGYTRYFDEEASAPWLYNPDERIAISYEDERSARAKALYVIERQLGGVMAWQVNYDDKNSPLLDVLYQTLH